MHQDTALFGVVACRCCANRQRCISRTVWYVVSKAAAKISCSACLGACGHASSAPSRTESYAHVVYRTECKKIIRKGLVRDDGRSCGGLLMESIIQHFLDSAHQQVPFASTLRALPKEVWRHDSSC